MSNDNVISSAEESSSGPEIRKLDMTDLREAISLGIADFNTKPSHVVFLGLFYPIIAVVLARFAFGYDVLPLLFPLIAGFALIGPLAATGMYEMSRRLEKNLDVSWKHAFDVFRSPSLFSIALLGFVQTSIFVGWLFSANAIYVSIFGDATPASIQDFATQIFATPEGMALIMIGSGVGFLFAVVVLSISVVSFPMVLDRNISAYMAVKTSVRAVIANPFIMAVWGFIVAGSLVIGSIPFFVGLAVVLPVLGHATWHLYRKVVARG